jgi:hypothetical protein
MLSIGGLEELRGFVKVEQDVDRSWDQRMEN